MSSFVSAKYYKDPKFWDLMNACYYPLDKMQASVEKLVQTQSPDFVKNIKYGVYQDILVDLSHDNNWLPSMKAARASLANQKNNLPILGRDYDGYIPEYKLELLDAVINYCFNNPVAGQMKNGIPMVIDVQEKVKSSPGDDLHDIHISWTYVNGAPVQLNWTMICPAE